jgi:hypothetical protein
MDLSNPNLWELRYIQSFTGDAVRGLDVPIPVFETGQLSDEIIRVRITNSTARDNWTFGGTAKQIINAGGVDTVAGSLSLQLNESLLWILQDYDSYKLKIKLPRYFKQATLSIFAYTNTRKAIKINCGGGAVGNWVADTYFSGGETYVYSGLGLINPDPPSGVSEPVFGEERSGNSFSYSIPNLSGSYTLKLYFNESGFNASGQRLFSVSANSQNILDNFDIFSEVGKNKVVAKQFNISVNGSLILDFVGIVDGAQINAIALEPV